MANYFPSAALGGSCRRQPREAQEAQKGPKEKGKKASPKDVVQLRAIRTKCAVAFLEMLNEAMINAARNYFDAATH